ncbi:MAG: nucleotidyl transferase AbiEii/AbiGii toxin family protein [Candidatus Heimdallarchaeota archaeon]
MFKSALDENTWKILRQLVEIPFLSDFYLAGGSAAALQLGHRISKDLDFFIATSFSNRELLQHLSQIHKPQVRQEEQGTLTVILETIPMSFFEYHTNLLNPPVLWESIRLASLLDVALMKIVAIGQRGSRRDFVDLYYIIRNKKWSLDDLLARIPEKYPHIDFPLYHFTKSLSFFDDAEEEPPLRMLDKTYRWDVIPAFFKETAKNLAKNI